MSSCAARPHCFQPALKSSRPQPVDPRGSDSHFERPCSYLAEFAGMKAGDQVSEAIDEEHGTAPVTAGDALRLVRRELQVIFDQLPDRGRARTGPDVCSGRREDIAAMEGSADLG